MFGDGKYLANRGEEKEKIFGEGKYLVSGGEKERRRKRRKMLDIRSCHGLVTLKS